MEYDINTLEHAVCKKNIELEHATIQGAPKVASVIKTGINGSLSIETESKKNEKDMISKPSKEIGRING